jgi:hypothetical protein
MTAGRCGRAAPRAAATRRASRVRVCGLEVRRPNGLAACPQLRLRRRRQQRSRGAMDSDRMPRRAPAGKRLRPQCALPVAMRRIVRPLAVSAPPLCIGGRWRTEQGGRPIGQAGPPAASAARAPTRRDARVRAALAAPRPHSACRLAHAHARPHRLTGAPCYAAGQVGGARPALPGRGRATNGSARVRLDPGSAPRPACGAGVLGPGPLWGAHPASRA